MTPILPPPDPLPEKAVMERTIASLEERLAQGWRVNEPPRSVIDMESGQLLLMAGWDGEALGVKVITVRPDGGSPEIPHVQGVYLLFDLPRLAPTLTLDARFLTTLRTPAVSAVATRHLSPDRPSRLVVFGTGPQAAGHILAMHCVREIRSVTVVARDRRKAESFVATMAQRGFTVRSAGAEAVAEADIVCTCTTSTTPVFDGRLLREDAHVNAVGSHDPEARELDDATFEGSLVVVESVDAALREAGDVILARRSGSLPASEPLHELAHVVQGLQTVGRPRRTIFKSVGTAGQDLVAAQSLRKEGLLDAAQLRLGSSWAGDGPAGRGSSISDLRRLGGES